MDRSDPSALRWLIGVELASHRRRAGQSQAAAAKEIGCSAGMIGHFEKGMYAPQPAQTASLLEFYGAPTWDVERLTTLAGRTHQGSWLAEWNDVLPDWLKTYMGLEGLASHMVTYAPLVLPALVQTAAYAAGVTAPSARVRPDQEERLVSLRMERQRRLHADEDPLQLTAIVEESVLERPIGEPGTMADQLNHLVELSQRDNVEILMLPTTVGRHDGLEGRFTVLEFDGRAQSIAYIEYPDGALYVQDQHQVAAYTQTAETLRSVALSPAATTEAIAARARRMT